MSGLLSRSIVTRFNIIILSLIIVGLTCFSLVIGKYNYNRTIQDIQEKTDNVSKLAALSLTNPIWDMNDEGISTIGDALWTDKDVVAISIFGIQVQDRTPLLEKKRDSLKNLSFEEMKNHS